MIRIFFRSLLSIGALFMILVLIRIMMLGVFEESLAEPAPIAPWVFGSFLLAGFSGIFFLSVFMLKGVSVLVKHVFQLSYPSWLSGIEILCMSFYLVGLLVVWGILLSTGEIASIKQAGLGFPIVVFLGVYLLGICLLILFNSIKESVRIFKRE